jgi:hypothetical protein
MRDPFALEIDRRRFLRRLGILSAGGFGAALVACSGSSTGGPGTPAASGPPGSLSEIASGLRQVSVLSPETPVNPGTQIFTYAIVGTDNRLVTAPSKVYLGSDPNAKASGPFEGRWYEFTGYAATGDRSPQSNLTGIYVSTIEVDQPGMTTVVVSADVNGSAVGGSTVLPVTEKPVVAAVGSKAISYRSPVATTPSARAQICTRQPPCSLHSISIDEALRNGRPSVICFATPLLCESRLCGPTLDEVILVAQDAGARANAIHIEEFLPGKDLQPPPPQPGNLSPTFKAWGFDDEPWVIVVDGKGTIRGRLGPGGTVAPEIMHVLQALL